MSYFKFDAQLLTNLEKSLTKEILRPNALGGYGSTTIIDCNTRKYHGLLVVPVPQIDDDRHVLLSSCDETIIQHGAEFNLGIHKYQGDHYSPRGHKYLREFYADSVATSIYRVGGVILKKQRIFVQQEHRILISYELLQAHSATTLRLKPFLAFRNANTLTQENYTINKIATEAENGVSFCLYNNYPNLVMQTNKHSTFVHQPDWYRGIEYFKEQERGYAYKEDLFVPGYFELPIKKGEVIIFSAGLAPMASNQIKRLFDAEKEQMPICSDTFSCLKSAAQQFYNQQEDGSYLLAGYPWFKYRARDAFISLPGTTLAIDNQVAFEQMMQVAVRAVDDFLNERPQSTALKEICAPDVLLWFIWTVQQYAAATSIEQAAKMYGDVVFNILNFIRRQKHPNLFVSENSLLYTDGKQKPATWMNAVENGNPITPRSGYVVEINALWYNALRFTADLALSLNNENQYALLNYQAATTSQAFIATFWNGAYLYDYVDGDYRDKEVRPNMIFAVSLPYSPLDKKQQKTVLDIVTRELLTIKGLRSLSPKSGIYRPNYVGGQLERDRNYHNGPVWPWTIGAFSEAYLKIYKLSSLSFLYRMLAGFDGELTELTIGTISELYDGNPPFRGHGAMSFAMSVAELLRTLQLLNQFQINLQKT